MRHPMHLISLTRVLKPGGFGSAVLLKNNCISSIRSFRGCSKLLAESSDEPKKSWTKVASASQERKRAEKAWGSQNAFSTPTKVDWVKVSKQSQKPRTVDGPVERLQFREAIRGKSMSAYDILTTIPVEIVKSFTFTDFVGMFKLLKRTENDKTPSRMRKVMAIMDEAGMPLSTTLYSYLAAAYADAGDIEGVHAVVKEVEDKKLPPIVNMDTYLGRAYGSLGKIEEARRYALLIAESRTKETSASHISGIVDSILRYANNSASDEALQGALALSQETDVLLNERAYNHIIMFYIARKDVDNMMANLRAKHALGYPSDMFVYTKAMHLLLNEKRDAEGVITLYAEVRARKLTPSSSVISVVFEAAILLKDPETALKVMHEARTAKWYLAEDVGYCSFFARAMMTKPELFNDLPGFYQKALPGEHPNLMVLTDLIKGLRRLTVSDPNGKYIRKVCQVYQTFTGHPDYKNEAVNLTIRALLERKQFDAAYDLFNTDALLKNDPFANNAFVGYLSGSGKYKEMWEWIEGMKSIFSRIDASTWGVAFAGTWKEGEKFGEEANKVLAKFRECFFDSTLEVGVRRAAGMMKKYGSLAKAFAKKGDGDIKKGIESYFAETAPDFKQAASTSKGASAESA